MILLIDNYDSFTYNLYQFAGEINADIKVVRNNKISIEEIKAMNPEKIILSPGPKRPEDAGICIEVVKELYDRIPILGVCLGHQVIGMCFGAKILRCDVPVHGKVSEISHNLSGVFKDIRQDIKVTRYHSLFVDRNTLSSDLEITAVTKKDNIIMGIKHKKYNLFGLQFHPESIYTEYGKEMIKNFLNIGGVCNV